MATRGGCSWHQGEGRALNQRRERDREHWTLFPTLAWGIWGAGVAPSKAQILAVLLSSLGFLLLPSPPNPLVPDVPSLLGSPEAGRHPSGSCSAEPTTTRLLGAQMDSWFPELFYR